MKDQIVIAEAMGGQIRIHAATTTNLVNEAVKIHHCMATSAAALGRTMTVTSIMASDLKNKKDTVTCIFNGHGPAGTVFAQADGDGHVKGFIANPNVYLVKENGHLDVGKAIGTDGVLTVSRDLGLKEPFTGTVQIQTGEVGDDFAYYYAISEQTPSVVGVGVMVNPDGAIAAAGGLIYQLLPDASDEVRDFCESTLKAEKPVSQTVHEGKDPEAMIKMYFPDAVILEKRPIEWYCGCSHEHYAAAIATLPTKEIQAMIDEDKGAEVVCRYCEKKYYYTDEELKQILEARKRVGDR